MGLEGGVYAVDARHDSIKLKSNRRIRMDLSRAKNSPAAKPVTNFVGNQPGSGLVRTVHLPGPVGVKQSEVFPK